MNAEEIERAKFQETLDYFEVSSERELLGVRYWVPWNEQWETGFSTWRDAYQHMLREEGWWSSYDI